MNDSPPKRLSLVLGWIGVACSTAIASFWAFWGIIENFHEGWYFESLWSNLKLMVGQYLPFMLAFLALGAFSIRWPKAGAVLHAALAIFALKFFSMSGTSIRLIVLPIALIAACYWFGNPLPKRRAWLVLWGCTMLTLTACGAEPAWRIIVVGRHNDGDLSARVVEGNGVRLVWAPDGPGWPQKGTEWEEARRICRFLNEDGLSLADTPQNIWRLPTAHEAVRSMHRGGKHCGGVWDGKAAYPDYQRWPDKESPLWNVRSQVIYWWTATEIDSEWAYNVCFNGQVRPRRKDHAPNYFSFRAVKDPPKTSGEP